MGSWMEKYERREDAKREKMLNDILERYIEDYDKCNTSIDIDKSEKIRKLEAVIEAYKSLIIEAYNYDEEDFKNKEQELSRLKYEVMQEKYNESEESQSWEEYRREEDEER